MKFNTNILEPMQRLNKLTELKISLKYHEPTEFSTQKLPKLNQIKVLHLNLIDKYDNLNVELFCQFFSNIFTNIKHLIICHEITDVLLQIKQHLNSFDHLQSYRLYTHEDELKYLGRHAIAAKQDDNRIYSESIIRKIKIQKLDLTEKIEISWQKEL